MRFMGEGLSVIISRPLGQRWGHCWGLGVKIGGPEPLGGNNKWVSWGSGAIESE